MLQMLPKRKQLEEIGIFDRHNAYWKRERYV